MLTPEIAILCVSAASIAFVHTLLGPDHYLPFIALARSRNWSVARTLRVTLLCGSGHIVGSVLLGALGLYIGIQLSVLEWVEGIRGDLAAWALVSFGLLYMAWGLRRAWRAHPGGHAHRHAVTADAEGGVRLSDEDGACAGATGAGTGLRERTLVAWTVFIIFVLGPCEPLIPILMFPAARESVPGLVAVTAVFAVVTVMTMLGAVLAALWGTRQLRLPALERFGQAIAGCTILCCGLAISVLGL